MENSSKMGSTGDELSHQGTIPWNRGGYFSTYEKVLGECTVRSVLDYAKGPSLLELACGNGLVTSMLAPHFERVVGVDASWRHITEARARHKGIDFVQTLAEDYQSEEPFTTITMLYLLEHVLDPVSLLRSAVRNLHEEGVLIIHVPNALAVNRRIATLMRTLENEYELSPFDIEIVGHRRSYDLRLLVEHVVSAGLKVLHRGGVFYKMLSSPQINWLLEKGPWEEGGFGWGRVGSEKSKNWRKAFCDACYEFGKDRPEDCNGIYVVAQKQ